MDHVAEHLRRRKAPTRGGRARSPSSCPPGTKCGELRRRRRQLEQREGHRRRLVRVRRVVARDAEPRADGADYQRHRPLPRRLATSTAAGSTRRCSPASACTGQRAVQAGDHARLRARRERQAVLEERRSRRRAPEGKKVSYIEPDDGHQEVAAPRCSGCGSRRPSSAPTSRTRRRSSTALAEWYRKLRNTARFLLGNLKDFDPDRARSLDRDARRSIATCSRGSTSVVDARAQGVRGVRVPRRAPPARRLRHRRHLGVLRRRHEGSPVLRCRRLAGAARRAGRACTSACARSRRWRRRSCVHRRGHLAATCRSARAIPTACTSRCSRGAARPMRRALAAGLRRC